MIKRPPLTADRWRSENEPEFMEVRSGAVAEITRASRAMGAIGRILHNSIGDDDDSKVVENSLDNLTKQNLAGAIECLSDYIYDIIEDMNITSARLTSESGHE